MPILTSKETAAISSPAIATPGQRSTFRLSVPAIVLCNTVTGIATVRALAASGVEVHAFIFNEEDPLHDSRYGIKVPCYHLRDDDGALVRFLIEYAVRLGERPAVFPTSDAHALLLSQYAAKLEVYCRIWRLSHTELGKVVNKTTLYQTARAAGVPVIPSISTPTVDALEAWSREHAGPYILKPSYEGVSSCKLESKNLVLTSREELLDYVRQNGADSLVVQRMIRGGDGNIFDCYGLCDRNGRVVTLTSHHRIRQYPPDFGATSLGEIPAPLPSPDEQFLFEATERLFGGIKFHGIFGIEWLRDEKTGEFFLIDFNARPFLTIGHLRDCGVNLPLLAYWDLIERSLDDVERRPRVKRKRWVYITKDIDSFRMLRCAGRVGLKSWLLSVSSCTSFAYVSWRDPKPGFRSIMRILKRMVCYAFRTRRTPIPAALAVESPVPDLTLTRRP